MAKSKSTNAEKIESEHGDKQDIIQVQSIRQLHRIYTIDCNNMTIKKSDCGINYEPVWNEKTEKYCNRHGGWPLCQLPKHRKEQKDKKKN